MNQQQPQEQKAPAEGRFDGPMVVIIMLLLSSTFLVMDLRQIAYDRICVSGWGGYSAGSEIYLAIIIFFVLAMVTVGVLFGWLIKRSASLLMVAFALILTAAPVRFLLQDYERYPLISPAEILQCQSPQPAKTGVSETTAGEIPQ
ncbi:MAG: hypothetical protein LBP94_00540 [Zoogloeaceae bacterium]|jgi:hypothetical protein|nr:hypothetical protein [Zoogloeaceae bacterium]